MSDRDMYKSLAKTWHCLISVQLTGINMALSDPDIVQITGINMALSGICTNH